MPEDMVQGIERPPFWLPMSPDLNMIEPCWGYLKDMLVDRDWFTSASKNAQEQAKRILADEIGQQGYFLHAQHQIRKFPEQLQKVLDHDGNNNFKG